jgi:hypothetical protein
MAGMQAKSRRTPCVKREATTARGGQKIPATQCLLQVQTLRIRLENRNWFGACPFGVRLLLYATRRGDEASDLVGR